MEGEGGSTRVRSKTWQYQAVAVQAASGFDCDCCRSTLKKPLHNKGCTTRRNHGSHRTRPQLCSLRCCLPTRPPLSALHYDLILLRA